MATPYTPSALALRIEPHAIAAEREARAAFEHFQACAVRRAWVTRAIDSGDFGAAVLALTFAEQWSARAADCAAAARAASREADAAARGLDVYRCPDASETLLRAGNAARVARSSADCAASAVWEARREAIEWGALLASPEAPR